MLYGKSLDSHDINLVVTVILTITVNIILTRKVILRMNERIEIEVIACCPECGHSYSDWILLDMGHPLFFDDSDDKNTKIGGENDVK